MTTFKKVLSACGLSQKEASDFLDVSIQSIKGWCQGRNPPPIGAVGELSVLYYLQLDAVNDAFKLWKDAGSPDTVEFGVAVNNHEAQSLGLPCIGAHMMVGALLQLKIAPARVTIAKRVP